MFEKLRENIQQTLATEPIECPRGWGKVAFKVSGAFLWPFVWLGRECPIAGAESCASCEYASNPDAMHLKENLAALDELRRTGVLAKEEYAERRGALLALHPERDRGAGFRITAWILGPLGVLLTTAGVSLAPRYGVGFWVMAAFGAVALALTLSFAMVCRRPAEDSRLHDGRRP